MIQQIRGYDFFIIIIILLLLLALPTLMFITFQVLVCRCQCVCMPLPPWPTMHQIFSHNMSTHIHIYFFKYVIFSSSLQFCCCRSLASLLYSQLLQCTLPVINKSKSLTIICTNIYSLHMRPMQAIDRSREEAKQATLITQQIEIEFNLRGRYGISSKCWKPFHKSETIRIQFFGAKISYILYTRAYE